MNPLQISWDWSNNDFHVVKSLMVLESDQKVRRMCMLSANYVPFLQDNSNPLLSNIGDLKKCYEIKLDGPQGHIG